MRRRGRGNRFVAVITKRRLSRRLLNAHVAITWTDVHGRLAKVLADGQADRASTVWASLVSRFLEKAEQTSFQGFHGDYGFRDEWLTPAFRLSYDTVCQIKS
jgi:hypothetical protein